jgi:hypothetical protein
LMSAIACTHSVCVAKSAALSCCAASSNPRMRSWGCYLASRPRCRRKRRPATFSNLCCSRNPRACSHPLTACAPPSLRPPPPTIQVRGREPRGQPQAQHCSAPGLLQQGRGWAHTVTNAFDLHTPAYPTCTLASFSTCQRQ